MVDEKWEVLDAVGSPAWRAAREPAAAQELATVFNRLQGWDACGDALAFVARAPSAAHAYVACDRPDWLEWLYESLEERLRVFLRDGRPCPVTAAWSAAHHQMTDDSQLHEVFEAWRTLRHQLHQENDPATYVVRRDRSSMLQALSQAFCDAYRRHYPFELVRQAFQVAAAREVRDA